MSFMRGAASRKTPDESPETIAVTLVPSSSGSAIRVNVIGKVPSMLVALTIRPGSNAITSKVETMLRPRISLVVRIATRREEAHQW